MDIELREGMDGAQTARIILQFADIPIVFFTAYTEKEIVEKIRSVTGYGYVLKVLTKMCWYPQLKWRLSFMKQMLMRTCTGKYLKIH